MPGPGLQELLVPRGTLGAGVYLLRVPGQAPVRLEFR